jgi:hypothetical protein
MSRPELDIDLNPLVSVQGTGMAVEGLREPIGCDKHTVAIGTNRPFYYGMVSTSIAFILQKSMVDRSYHRTEFNLE